MSFCATMIMNMHDVGVVEHVVQEHLEAKENEEKETPDFERK